MPTSSVILEDHAGGTQYWDGRPNPCYVTMPSWASFTYKVPCTAISSISTAVRYTYLSEDVSRGMNSAISSPRSRDLISIVELCSWLTQSSNALPKLSEIKRSFYLLSFRCKKSLNHLNFPKPCARKSWIYHYRNQVPWHSESWCAWISWGICNTSNYIGTNRQRCLSHFSIICRLLRRRKSKKSKQQDKSHKAWTINMWQ